jgi:hypothetical protein
VNAWVDVPFTIDTPMFIGGAGQDCDPGAQLIPTLRGALRSWFRALVGPAYEANTEGLAAAESAVFGRAADDTSAASPLHLRLRGHPTVKKPPDHDWIDAGGGRHAFGITYLLGQGLWDHHGVLRRQYLPPGAGAVSVRGPDDRLTVVRSCLWALQTFGGLGSRNRKGFGAVTFDPSDVVGPAWQEPSNWPQMAAETQAAVARIAVVGPPRKSVFATIPTYGCFTSKSFSPVVGEAAVPLVQLHQIPATYDAWPDVLRELGERWRCLRTVLNADGAGYRPRVETPQWKDVVHGTGTDFAVGALGLPINFKGKVTVGLYQQNKELRHPGPIRFRPTKTANKWGATICALVSRPVPADAQLRLSNPRRTLTLDDEQATREVTRAMSELSRPPEWPIGAW